MAQPIPFHPPPQDPREVLRRRIEEAPIEHAEALLSVFEIVQLLHDKGLLEIAKGALGSGEKVMKIAADAADTPEVVQGIRNFMILTKLFALFEPELLEHVAGALPKTLEKAKTDPPMGILSLLSLMASADTRRALGVGASVMAAMGQGLSKEDQLPK